VSVLSELDRSCNTVLPDNGDKPSEPGLFDMPPEVMRAIGKELPLPPFPRRDTTFELFYDFGSARLGQAGQAVLEMAAKFAMANQAKRVVVIGFAAESRLSSGDVLAETLEIAALRTQAVGKALLSLGLQPQQLSVTPSTLVDKGDGVGDADRRRVTVLVEMPAAER
jgi:outer membrane protein OmpA-like peptidoglycan-associated protein